MKQKTRTQLAKELGISRETLRRIGKLPGAPANLNDTEAWRSFYAPYRVQPMPGATVPGMATGEQIDAKQLDYQQARTLRTIYAAERERVALEQARGNLIPKGDVVELLSRLGAMVKMRLMRLPGELPPVLEGCTAAQIEKILDDRMRAVLSAIADASAFGGDAAEPAQS